MLSRGRRRVALVLALLWAGLLYYLSDQPGLHMPQLFSLQDKLVHLAVYAVLGALAMASRPLSATERRGIEYWRVCVLVAIYAALDELHQYFVPGRSADVLDWLADCAGVLLGAGLVWWLAGLHKLHMYRNKL